jgi:hypothetical protein
MPARSTRRVAAVFIACSTVFAWATAHPAGASESTPTHSVAPVSRTLDVRLPVASADALAVRTSRAEVDLGRSLGRMGVFSLDPRTGTLRVVGRLDGFLTPPSARPPAQVAMGYVRAHLDAFGLAPADLRTFVPTRDYVDIDGTHHLAWAQEASGIRAFDNGLEASVTADGELVTLSGSPARGLGEGASRTHPALSASSAIGRARTAVGAPAHASPNDRATLVWFHGGRSHLAWQTLTNVSAAERDLSVVDAATGEVLWRTNLVHTAQGTGLAWEYFPSSALPSGNTQQPVTFPVKANWRLLGPNAHVYLDAKDDGHASNEDQIASTGSLDWSATAELRTNDANQNCRPKHPCSWNKNISKSWRENLRQNAVQVYWYLNQFHDHLEAAPIGFTDAAGNFEVADRVRAEIFDGASTAGGVPDFFHYNNANMYTPPDGTSPIMQMYLFRKAPNASGWPSANAGDDASVVYHEYTHGLSSRLVTYPSGVQALNSWQSGAMGEGWSDFYAMDLLVDRGAVTDTAIAGEVMVGKWITGGEGIREQAIDCAVGAAAARCPAAARTGSGGFTYGDFAKVDDGPEVHGDGEIWAQTLWDLRAELGARLTRRLVTRAMELSPPDPSFLDMRNAIVQADLVATRGDNARALWSVFRGRGMGFYASAVDGDDVSPVESFAAPPSCVTDPCGTIRGHITDSVTGRPVPGAVVSIGGHASGFPSTDLVGKTDAQGRYAITRVPFHTYADLVIDRWGLDPTVLHGVTVNGNEVVSRAVTRDWAALDGGADIVSFSPPDYTAFGCGPSGAFDRSLGAGWGSDAPDSTFGSFRTGARSIVIRLPRAIDVTSFAIDPGATCGDASAAAVKTFDVLTRTASGRWVLAFRTSTALPQGTLTKLGPIAGRTDVRLVKLTMRTNRGDPLFMDMTELSVRGRA